MFDYWIDSSDRRQLTMIDEGRYNASELIEVKIPLRLHYYSSSLEYERYYGEVEVAGTYYSYVMRKVMNDTVYLLCIPNMAKSVLEKEKSKAMLAITGIGGSSDPMKGKSNDGKKLTAVTDVYLQPVSGQWSQYTYSDIPAADRTSGAVIAGFETNLDHPPQKMIQYRTNHFYSTGVSHPAGGWS